MTALAIPLDPCHNERMATKKRKKKALDLNEFAASVLEAVTGEAVSPEPAPEEKAKDPAAVALGRKGGLKGGPARAKKLGKKKLSAAARKAAKARWSSR